MTQHSTTLHTRDTSRLHMRKPTKDDGAAIWALIAACPPLDQNSMYMNLIQCDQFADTCIVAERDGQIVGWISGHIRPDAPDTLFVWQVAVHASARGLGLGRRMLSALVARPECAATQQMETTITRDNAASWALFRGFARAMGGELTDAPHFERDAHLGGKHATEHLVAITLPRRRLRAAA
ncbi:MAG: diaminobutyrate acetyltransferase [Pararhodobacter sp.]|nr:diaminobutyrate acetyltransferase [Pararhodobacter sp.]